MALYAEAEGDTAALIAFLGALWAGNDPVASPAAPSAPSDESCPVQLLRLVRAVDRSAFERVPLASRTTCRGTFASRLP